ncbi:creatininase family protein [bacterium]
MRTILFMIIVSLLLIPTIEAQAQTPGAFLGHLTWPEAEERLKTAEVVILPFAAGAKEHGPHLPMNADQNVMEYLCRAAVDSVPVLVAPPILHGWFAAFRDYPGTEISDAAVFRDYVYQAARSLIRSGARRIVLLNMGVSRASGLPMAIAAREIRTELEVPVLLISWDDLETKEVELIQEQKRGGHADEIETSINLYLNPQWVHMDRAVRDDALPGPGKKYPGYKPGLFSRNSKDPAYSETGLFGDPTLATTEKGKKILAIMTRNWIRALKGFSKSRLPQ